MRESNHALIHCLNQRRISYLAQESCVGYYAVMIGSDELDTKILRSLVRSSATVPELARTLGISKTTTEYRLKRLLALKSVERKCIPGRPPVIKWTIGSSRLQFKNYVSIYRNQDMVRAAAALMRVRKKTTIYLIEGKKAIEITNHKSSNKPMSIKLQNMFRRRQIINKIIVHPDTPQTMLRVKNETYIKARKKRVIDMRFLPHRSLLGPGYYIFAPNMIVIFSEAKKYAVVIRDEPVTRMLYDMIALLFDNLDSIQQAKHFDFARFIEQLIEKRAVA
jgi:hypothetical protein